MPQGLEIRDAAGNVIFDTNTNASRIIATITTGTSDGSFSIPAVNNRILPWPTKYATAGIPPNVTVSGTTVSWSFGSTPVAYRTSATVLVMGY